jgi:hypothetical protein
MALSFRDSEVLQVILRSGVCPPEVLSRGAQVARAADGAVVLAPDKPLPNAALAKLRAAGVVVDAALPSDTRAVRCWAEAIAPVRIAVPVIPSLVVFVTQTAAELLDLAAELVRLGCDRQELLVVPEGRSESAPVHPGSARGVIRVVDPPTYTVVRAIDRERGLRVFAPDPAGQELVWTELGYRHPIAEQLRAEPGTLLLVAADGWQSVPDTGWIGLDAALELAVPGDGSRLAPSKLPARRRVELRLATGRREVPSLWVLRDGAVAAIDRLLAYLPEDVVGRLTFAATGGPDRPTIVVRARTGRHPPPDLSLGIGAEEYAQLAQMPDLYAPAGAIVEPPLRRERLRSIIGIATGEIVWLARVDPEGGSTFRVERIAESAFAPLAEWADYVIHASAPALVPWMRASVFDFAAFVSTGLEWASGPHTRGETPDDAAEPKKKKRGRARGAEPPPQPIAVTVPHAAAQPTAATRAAAAPVAFVPIDEELAACEAEFVALDAPGDAPERLALLERLGHIYARLGRRRDAGLCFARAVWESTPAEAATRLDTWIAADLHGADPRSGLESALALSSPPLDEVRFVAALAAQAGPLIKADPHRVHRWLDDHDAELDARTLWIARVGLAGLAGGDTLGLAHARDRILARLAAGLPVERELPAFLRFAGRSGALGNASGEHLATALEDLVGRVDRTKRKRSPVEAPVVQTRAYVGFQLAHGFARIGKHERARQLVGESRQALSTVAKDPVHAYLAAAYEARVDQAIAGLAPETALPEALGTQLAALDRIDRYKVDRLREASRILEPLERPDPIGAFSRLEKDSRGPEFAALRTIAETAARAKAVDKLVDVATRDEAQRERLVDGIFDVLLELPENTAVPILLRTWPLIADIAEPGRAVLYAEALVVAGHFGRTELVPELLDVLGSAIRVAGDLERVLQQSLRALRRIGLRHEIAELLAEAEHALPANENAALRGKLALAAGLAFLGDAARAMPIFAQARQALDQGPNLPDRLALTRALALAYAQAPLGSALGGISELATQLKDITDTFGTNTHYCLAVLHFVESLILGITSDDLALGEAGRRFVEDDEHLIRRRLHRDLGGH